ncbi:MAG: ribonuclease H-like domain-containing protein [Acidobacteria bacterium]|nr:ribonuclease H-like domain-containing protein [Acidobacteriota bacterium]
MTLAERLRSVVRSGASLSPGSPPRTPARRGEGSPGEPEGLAPEACQNAADVLGGQWRQWQAHRYLVVDRKYLPGHRHGRVAVADSAPDASGFWPTLGILDPAASGGRVVFLDLETTGLSGGAGTYAFLVGCGWFDAGTFRVRQFLLTGYAAERGLLEAVEETVAGAGAIATYNGKTFDLPIIETRCLLHRMATPFEGLAHVDLLHPARRLWKSDEARLAAMDASVLGHVRENDVPGFEIPSRYFLYVRSGDPRPLEPVLEHNRLDLLSLAMLTARVARLLEQGPDAAGTAREALGLGRLYERRGMLAEARACFARAAGPAAAEGETAGEVLTRAEALRGYAVLCRRAREHEAAADAWHQVLELSGCPPHLAREAREALAVHCEHRLRDFGAARRLAVESLRFGTSAARTQAIRHRVARLDRKLNPNPIPFF